MVVLQIPLHAFRAKHAPIEREVLPRLESDHAIITYLQLNAALLPAKAAVRFHQPVWHCPRLFRPSAFRHVVQVRPELFPKLVERHRRFSHASSLVSASTASAKESFFCKRGKDSARYSRRLAACNRNRAEAEWSRDRECALPTRTAART